MSPARATHRATLGGQPLPAFGPIEWRFTSGVNPFQITVEVDLPTAERLGALAGAPMTLVLEDEAGPRLTVEEVYVLGVLDGHAPHAAAVLLSDRRWRWHRRYVKRLYNLRRRTGDRVLLEDEGLPTAIPFVADDYAYHRASLKGERTPWTARDVLVDVLTYVDGREPAVAGLGASAQPVENLEIDSPGDAALAVALDLVAGTNVRLEPGGAAVIYSETDHAAVATTLGRTGPHVVGGGQVRFASFAAERPATIRVLFTPEQEVRFDSVTEDQSNPGETVTVEAKSLRRNEDRREMENVLPLPDATTAVRGRTLARGTYVPVNDAVGAWGSSLADGQSVSLPLIRELWLSNLDGYMTGLGLSAPDGNQVSRLGALRRHYRQTYRLNPRWVARTRHLEARRVAIIHPETGTRAPAVAYADYAILPSMKGRRWREELGRYYVTNVAGYSTSLAGAKPAPAVVQVLDEDQGIVRVEYHVEPLGLWQAVIPSLVENIPVFRPRDGRLVLVDTPGDRNGAPRLAAGHRVAVVLTAVPAAPNSNGCLYAIEVAGSEAAELAGIGGQPCRGPTWEVRVNPGLATARFAWSDDLADQIEQRFGVGKDFQPPATQNVPSLEVLLVNPDETKKIARAVAAVVVAALADRHVGAKTVRLDPSILPAGMLDTIAHRLAPDGALTSTMTFSREVPVPNVLALVDQGTRQRLLRFIDQGQP